ncbi:hypothetical protein PT974_06309 [Cladobotryum mycophilum]|uniref:Cdc24/Scd1 N-terminal domain-containing protein n=1 Tax=Cladobotryum mycophilum TaxID=491253 RepID=A0ABR0SL68_9HYPO
MDPLSVTTSIKGLISAASLVAKLLGPYVSATNGTPQIAFRVHEEVNATRVILSGLQSLAQNLASSPAPYASLIQVDDIVAILTDAVLLFSELESFVGSLPPCDLATHRPSLLSRLTWANKENDLEGLLKRLQGVKGSLSLVLMILNSDSHQSAVQFKQDLSIKVDALLESNLSLSKRLMSLENAFDTQTIVPKQQGVLIATDETSSDCSHEVADPPGVMSSFDFDHDLKSSRVYRRAKRETMDFSFRSSMTRPNSWSIFSGLSLGDVSAVSVIALPVYREDLKNAKHYDFGADLPSSSTTTLTEAPSRLHLVIFDCIDIQSKLSQISGFSDLFEEQQRVCEDSFFTLWAVLKKGFPLLMLLNAIDDCYDPSPFMGSHLTDPELVAGNAVEVFLRACYNDLNISANKLFAVSDLIGDNIESFLNVIGSLSFILEMLLRAGIVTEVHDKSLLVTCWQDNYRPKRVSGDVLKYRAQTLRSVEKLLDIMKGVNHPINLSTNHPGTLDLIKLLADFHMRLSISIQRSLLQQVPYQQWEDEFTSYLKKRDTNNFFMDGIIRHCKTTHQGREETEASPEYWQWLFDRISELPFGHEALLLVRIVLLN